MRDYAKDSPKFWEQGSGRRLRGDYLAQLVAQYLISAPASNMIGLYFLPLPTLAHHVGSPLEGASRALGRVCRAGFAAFDQATDLVWVFNAAEFEFGDALKMGDNRIANIGKLLKSIGNHPFVKGFLHRYGKAYRLDIDIEPSPLEGPWEPLTSPSEGASEQKQDQEQKQEQVNTIPAKVEKPKRERLPGAAPSGATVPIRVAWCREYEKKYGQPAAWGRRENGQAAQLLGTYTPEELVELIPYFFAWQRPEVIRAGHSFGKGAQCFVMKLDELRADIADRQRRLEAAQIQERERLAESVAVDDDGINRINALDAAQKDPFDERQWSSVERLGHSGPGQIAASNQAALGGAQQAHDGRGTIGLVSSTGPVRERQSGMASVGAILRGRSHAEHQPSQTATGDEAGAVEGATRADTARAKAQ